MASVPFSQVFSEIFLIFKFQFQKSPAAEDGDVTEGDKSRSKKVCRFSTCALCKPLSVRLCPIYFVSRIFFFYQIFFLAYTAAVPRCRHVCKFTLMSCYYRARLRLGRTICAYANFGLLCIIDGPYGDSLDVRERSEAASMELVRT